MQVPPPPDRPAGPLSATTLQHPDAPPGLAGSGPWGGFAEAADAVLGVLQDRLGMELWAVTQVRGNHQEVMVARSQGFPIPVGAVLPWAESYCLRMIAGTAPRIAPRLRSEPAYADLPLTRRFKVGAYVGVPLVDGDGELFGTLCALSTNEQPARLVDELPLVELLARQLSTLLDKERLAADRSTAAAAAYALVERDPLTGALNRRGWERALGAEEERCRRSGRSSAVAVVDLDSLAALNRTHGHEAGDERLILAARVLEAVSRPADQVARIGGDEYAVLAPEADAECLDAWTTRLRQALCAAGLGTSIGAAARDAASSLQQAWLAAEDGVRAEQRARRACQDGRVGQDGH